ncbi:MAG: hypothetical protein GY913_32395 [Proteobacteria bacterium]|nr:hypothetical protein [Pseudomonadota bacterium]
MFWLLVSTAFGGDRAVVLLTGPNSGDVDARQRVAAALADSDIDQVAWATAGSLAQEIQLVGVDGRSEDAMCGGAVSAHEWEMSVARAETKIQLLDVEGALSGLSLAELEAACLDRPLDRQILQRLHLSVARAHLLAAQANDQPDFHEDQARRSVDAMQALGDDLMLPSGLEPEIQALIELRSYVESVPVAAGGNGRVLVDGNAIGRLPRGFSPGPHVAQVVRGGVVVGNQLVELDERPTLIWDGLLEPSDLIIELELAGSGQSSSLLEAIAGLYDEPVLIASVRVDSVVIHEADGTPVRSRTAPELPDAPVRVDEPEIVGLGGPFLVGAGPGLGWVMGEPRDVAGVQAGLSIWGRYAVTPDLRVAAQVGGLGRRDPLPLSYGGAHLYRAVVPGRVGVRLAREGRVGLELGADALVVWSGRFEDSPGVRVAGVLAASAARPLSDGYRLKLDAWGGGGLRYVTVGGTLGVERSF